MLFQIYGDTALWQLLGWALVFTGLVLANEIARRSKAGGIFFFLVLPAALSVYFIVINVAAAKGVDWAVNNDTVVHMNSWFHYAKLYAATAGCIGFMMLKYKWSIGKTQWFKVFPFVIVAINILIAVASDFESAIKGISAGGAAGGWWLSSENVWLFGGWWNILNGLAGIINILCMTGWWGIYSSKNHQDMLWPDMTWCYILAYDIWNFEYTPLLVLRPGSAAGAHLCQRTVEQGRLDPEPCLHFGHLVYVCPGVPAVPGSRQVRRDHQCVCGRVYEPGGAPHRCQPHSAGRNLYTVAGSQCGGIRFHYEESQGDQDQPLSSRDLHPSERLPAGYEPRGRQIIVHKRTHLQVCKCVFLYIKPNLT